MPHSKDLIIQLPNDVWSQINSNSQSIKVCFLCYFIVRFTTLVCADKWIQENSKPFRVPQPATVTQPRLSGLNNRTQTCRGHERFDSGQRKPEQAVAPSVSL